MDFIQNYLATTIQSAIKAGQAILDIYQSDFAVESKADKSPLTLADKRSHEIIAGDLAGFDIPLLSEEGRAIPYAERKRWERLWIVDPLDGTKEFIKRNGEFTVNIALVEKGRPVLGVIFVPVTGVLYFAARDMGSFKYETAAGEAGSLEIGQIVQRAVRLPITDAKESESEERPYTVVKSRSHPSPDLESYLEGISRTHGNLEMVAAGSSLKFCLVAEGKADIYPRLGPTSEWDTAAGQAVVEFAGGGVVQYDTKTPLIYNKEDILNPWFIVERK